MSQIPNDLLYTKEHEWVRKTSTPKHIQVGITDFAQASLGDVTFVQLPKVGTEIKRGQTFGSVESVKAVSDLYAPVTGRVSKINEALNNDPSPINTDPYNSAWMIEIELSSEAEMKELLSAQAYQNIAH
jgi:glycine cleavage system H protein